MSYHKGDAHIDEFSLDPREDDGYDQTYRLRGKQVIQLPHSCQDWIIGQEEEARQLIADLEELIVKLGTLPPPTKE